MSLRNVYSEGDRNIAKRILRYIFTRRFLWQCVFVNSLLLQFFTCLRLLLLWRRCHSTSIFPFWGILVVYCANSNQTWSEVHDCRFRLKAVLRRHFAWWCYTNPANIILSVLRPTACQDHASFPFLSWNAYSKKDYFWNPYSFVQQYIGFWS